MKKIKLFLCMLPAMLAVQTAMAETQKIVSVFSRWELTGSNENATNGIMHCYGGNRWFLETNDPSPDIVASTRWGQESDARDCTQFGQASGNSVFYDLRNQFEVSGKIKRVIVGATGYFESIRVILTEKSQYTPGSSQTVIKTNEYDRPNSFFNDYEFTFSDIDYNSAGFLVTITGPTPTYVSNITIEYDGDDPDKSGVSGNLSWKVEELDGAELSYEKDGETMSAPPYRLTISGKGEMLGFDRNDMNDKGRGSSAPWMKFPTVTEVVIDEGVTSVGMRAFLQLAYLNKVSLPGTVKSIGVEAFQECQLTEITLPEGLEEIKGNAFSMNKIEAVVIPASVKNIVRNPFWDNPLRSVTVAAGNETYDSRNNCNAIIATATNELVQGSETTVIPNDVVSIGEYAFQSMHGLKQMVIPNSVTTIGYYAFFRCDGMETLTIGSGVTYIDDSAFGRMESLTDVYCTADPENLTWKGYDGRICCKEDGTTQFHVADPEAWKAKFPNAHVQFVAIGSAESPEGDVSGDGKTDAEDVVALMNYIAGMTAGISATAADVNKDSKVDVADVVALVNMIHGK
jgi:hypothetical protein